MENCVTGLCGRTLCSFTISTLEAGSTTAVEQVGCALQPVETPSTWDKPHLSARNETATVHSAYRN
jgi:hypothetical protein